MACLRGPPTLAQHKKLRKLAVLKQMRPGLWVASSWPTNKTAATPKQKAARALFSQYAAATKLAWIGDQLQAISIAKDSGWYPRDVQIRAYAGNLLSWYDKSGNFYQPRRLAPPTPVPPPTPTWPMLIQRTVLSAPAAAITFTAIPQTYNDLLVILSARSAVATNDEEVRMTLNADAAAHYYWAESYANSIGNSVSGGTATNFARVAEISGANSPAHARGMCQILIPNYTDAGDSKQIVSSGGWTWDHSSSGQISFRITSQWDAQQAVTEVNLFPATGNFDTGTYATLYGM